METSEQLDTESNKDSRKGNLSLNGDANISGRTTAHSCNETTVDGGIYLQCSTESSSRKKRNKRENQERRQNPSENNVINHDRPEDFPIKTATLERNSNVGHTVDVNLGTSLQMAQCDSGSLLPGKKKGKRRKKNSPMDTDLLPQSSVLIVDSEMINYVAEASSNQKMNKGKEQKEMHNLVEINNGHDIQEGDVRPNLDRVDIKCLKKVDANSVSEVSEQLSSPPACVDTSSTGKKKRKRHNKKPNSPVSNGTHHNHQEGTPSLKNTSMETDLLPQPSVNTPLTIGSELINYDADGTSNQEMNKVKVQNDTHNLVEINNSHHIPEGGPNSVSEVAEQLNSLPDCADTNSRGKKKGKRRKKITNGPDGTDMHHNHQEGIPSIINTSMETDLLPQPSVNTLLKVDSGMINHDAEASSNQEMNKGKVQNDMPTLVEINSSHHIPEGDGGPNSVSEVAEQLNSLPDCADTSSGGKKKGKRLKPNANTLGSTDMHHNHQEGTPSMKNTPVETDLLPPPSVSTPLQVDLGNHDAEASSNQEMKKGTEQNEPPNSVLEVAEQLNSLPDCADTRSRGKKKGKCSKKNTNAPASTDVHYNHQEGTPSMKNTPMETDLRPLPSVNTPLRVDSGMIDHDADATSNQEMNKGKVQNDIHNLVEINSSRNIPEGDGGPNSVSEVAEQLNCLPDCADTSSNGKKKGKRRKKNTNAPGSTDMHHNHQEGTPSLKNTLVETDLLPLPSVSTPLQVDSGNHDAEVSSNQEMNKGKEQNEPHNLVVINNSHHIPEGDGGPNSVLEVAEQLISLPDCADTSSRGKKKGKCRKKNTNAPASTDVRCNHQEGTPSMKNTPMETDLRPQPSVNTPLRVDSGMIDHDADATSNQEMNKGKVQNDMHNLLEINSSCNIPEGDGGPNFVSEVAEQLNCLPDCADTSSNGKKKGKRRKKNTNAPGSTDMHHNHQEGTPSLKNTPMHIDLLSHPSVSTPLKVDSGMINHDAEASSNQEMDKGKVQNDKHNLVDFNDSRHIPEGDGGPNSVSEVAEQLNSLPDCVDTRSKGKKKGKSRKKNANASDGTDMHHNHPVGSASMKNTPVGIDLLPQPSVNTPLKVDSEIINYDAEASSNQEMNKGKEQNEPHNLVEINKGHDIRKDDGRPNVDIIDIKCLKNLDGNSVLEVAEQLSSLPDCPDASSRAEHDTHVEDDVFAIEAMDMKTYKRKKRVKNYSNERSMLSNAKENNLESVVECSGSSVLVVKNRVGDNSFACSDEALPSCCPENMLEREVLAGQGTSLKVVECILVEKASSLFSESESTAEEINQRMEMRISRQTINEGNFLKNVSIVDNPGENLEPDQKSKLKVAQNVEGNACSVEENNCEHTEVCKQKTMEIQSKMEDSKSSIKLDAIKEDGSPVLAKEDHPRQPLQQLPERALTSRSRRKLLILDLNGLLVDIVQYVPDGFKADTIIGRKELFKRPFCDDFLQFCFERFNVGVWSSRTKRNVDSVLDFLMGNSKRKLLFCWDQSHCTETGYNTIENREKPLLLKELRKLWRKHEPNLPWGRGEYNESNTLLLDDSPYKALLNPPHTAIFPRSYGYRDAEDNSLGPQGDLRVYLEGVALAENVQQYIEQNPFGQRPITKKNSSWAFYLKVLTTLSSPTSRWH